MPKISNLSLLYQCEYSTKITPTQRHFHMLYEIIFVAHGIIQIEVAGKSYIVERNSLIFFSNLEEHSVKILSTQYERYFLILSTEKIEQLIKDPVLVSLFKMRPDSFSHIFDAPDNTVTIMKRVLQEYQRNDQYSQDIIASYVKELLINLYRKDRTRFPISNKNIRPEIIQIQQYINDHFREDIKISDIAEQNFISPYYLSHTFKELTGYGPKHYLILTRLSYAKLLLKNSHDSIEDIAVKSGFPDSTSFIRSFKNEFSMTPKQYRSSQ